MQATARTSGKRQRTRRARHSGCCPESALSVPLRASASKVLALQKQIPRCARDDTQWRAGPFEAQGNQGPPLQEKRRQAAALQSAARSGCATKGKPGQEKRRDGLKPAPTRQIGGRRDKCRGLYKSEEQEGRLLAPDGPTSEKAGWRWGKPETRRQKLEKGRSELGRKKRQGERWRRKVAATKQEPRRIA